MSVKRSISPRWLLVIVIFLALAPVALPVFYSANAILDFNGMCQNSSDIFLGNAEHACDFAEYLQNDVWDIFIITLVYILFPSPPYYLIVVLPMYIWYRSEKKKQATVI